MAPLLLGCYFTFGFLLTREEQTLWLLPLFWIAPGGYLGWLLWCRRTGRDPRDNRFERWGADHPVMFWVIAGSILVAWFVLGRVVD